MNSNLLHPFFGGLLCLALISCTHEQTVAISAHFTTTVVDSDYSVPVRVAINNETVGADTYEWTFDGGIPSTSTQKNPGEITYLSSGTFSIHLKASNRDRLEEEYNTQITLYDSVGLAFTLEVIPSLYPPVQVVVHNHSVGAISFAWTFPGAVVENSTKQNPDTLLYTYPGNYKIGLTISNGKESYTQDTSFTVLPDLVPHFDWVVNVADNDYQAPVTICLQNHSISATHYEWTFSGANIKTSTDSCPMVTFTQVGTQKIVLTASNDKKQKSIEQSITIKNNSHLLVLNDIKLGINSSSLYGCFYSTSLQRVFTPQQVLDSLGAQIDLVFFGLNANFTFNQFESPDNLSSTTFPAIPHATSTVFINSQELTTTQVSVADFETIKDGSFFNNIVIADTEAGEHAFSNDAIPRIVLFQTAHGKKGAIEVKQLVSKGLDSYIVCDIKMVK